MTREGYAIPGYTLDAIDRWVNHGIWPGGFLTAVLTNNLSESFGRADENNLACLQEIARYVHWEIPGSCHGSIANMQEWSELKLTEQDRSELKQKEAENG